MLCQDEPLRVLHMSDLHLGYDPQWLYQGVYPWERLADTLVGVDPELLGTSEACRAPFDLVVITGDISHDQGEEVYLKLCAQLESLGVPVLVVPGNHDDAAAFQRLFAAGDAADEGGEVLSRCRREYSLGGWRILGLDSQVAGQVAGRLGDQQLSWLAMNLRQHPGQPTLIALHHAPVKVGTPWLDSQILEDSGAFLELVESFSQVRCVIFGHVHQEFDCRCDSGLRLLAAPAVSVQFQPGSPKFAVEPSPPGVRWIELCSDGRIQSEVWWLERYE